MSYEFNWTPQGWQCPVCHRVYSPTTVMCYFCGPQKTYTTTTATQIIDDKLKDMSVKDLFEDVIQRGNNK